MGTSPRRHGRTAWLLLERKIRAAWLPEEPRSAAPPARYRRRHGRTGGEENRPLTSSPGSSLPFELGASSRFDARSRLRPRSGGSGAAERY